MLIPRAETVILEGLVKIIRGAEFKSLGMLDAFQKPPFLVVGGGGMPYWPRRYRSIKLHAASVSRSSRM